MPGGGELFADAGCQLWLVLPGQVMLPDANHFPTGLSQRPIHQPVACSVSSELPHPKRAVRRRPSRVLWTAMPKATIDEQSQTLLPKNEVRFAEDVLVPPPPSELVASQDAQQGEFCPFVSAAVYARHYGRPFSRGEDIGHSGYQAPGFARLNATASFMPQKHMKSQVEQR
jgi:hypothetical protein